MRFQRAKIRSIYMKKKLQQWYAHACITPPPTTTRKYRREEKKRKETSNHNKNIKSLQCSIHHFTLFRSLFHRFLSNIFVLYYVRIYAYIHFIYTHTDVCIYKMYIEKLVSKSHLNRHSNVYACVHVYVSH